ncbi:MAG: amidohydrolase family protein, partial [Lachnospiraceae bacterium]|nr:amidohydrolase family protein [Lachnospiraceae bacterium]
MLKIYNAKIVDPATKLKGNYDLEIDKGIIMKVAPTEGKPEEGAIDATGLCLSPGFMDVHVHFRDPGQTHKEDILTGAKCAARGGFTDVVMMANTKPVIDSVETLEYVLKKGEETAINVHSCGSVTKNLDGRELTDMALLKEHGAVGFTDDGIPLMNTDVLRSVFEKAAELNVPISLHEEDKGIIKENGINHGAASDYYEIYGSPREAEARMIARDLKIALETGVTLDIQHISTKEGVEYVRKARRHS